MSGRPISSARRHARGMAADVHGSARRGASLQTPSPARRLKLLVVDELGYVPLSQTGAELLFEIFSQRHERGSNYRYVEFAVRGMDERLRESTLDRRRCSIASPTVSMLFLSATTGSLTPFSDPTKMFSTIAEFAWNTSSACPGKSSLSEPETGLIGHDQRDLTLPKRLDRFIAVAHSAIGARTTTVTPMGHPHPYRFSTFGLGECGCAALDRCFEPSHRFALNLYLAAIKRHHPSPG